FRRTDLSTRPSAASTSICRGLATLNVVKPVCIRDAVFMQEESQLPKAERHRLVSSLVERMRLGTQQELLEALRGAGCRVTQATVSRDIRELGLEKARDPLGRLRYVLPNRERRSDPRETLEALLRQFGRRAMPAQ